MYSYLDEKEKQVIEKDLFGDEPDKTVIIEDQVTLDLPRSVQEQRAVYRSDTYIRIRVHGRETGQFMSYPLRDHHKRQYPQAWEAYQATKGADQGTPCDVLLSFGVPPEDVATIKSAGALTLEQLHQVEGFDAAKAVAQQLLAAKEKTYVTQSNEGPPEGAGYRDDQAAEGGQPRQQDHVHRGRDREVEGRVPGAGDVRARGQHLRTGPEGPQHAPPIGATWNVVGLDA